jgi:hypothetical protein
LETREEQTTEKDGNAGGSSQRDSEVRGGTGAVEALPELAVTLKVKWRMSFMPPFMFMGQITPLTDTSSIYGLQRASLVTA